MRVAELALQAAVFVTPDTSVSEAASVAVTRRSEHLLVGEPSELRGIICSCDLDHAHRDAVVSELMRSPVVTVGDGAEPETAAELMRRHSIGALPVVAEGAVAGVLTRSALVRAGIPSEDAGWTCASCGEAHHLRPTSVPFCLECLDCAHDPADLGGGD